MLKSSQVFPMRWFPLGPDAAGPGAGAQPPVPRIRGAVAGARGGGGEELVVAFVDHTGGPTPGLDGKVPEGEEGDSW